MIRAVIFDFGNVVSAFDTSKFLKRLAARSPLSVDELSEAIYGSGLHSLYEAGAIRSPAFYREVVGRCRVDMGMPEFVEAFTDIFEPVEGTADLIRRVAAHCPVGLLSNTNPWHFARHIRKSAPWPHYSTVTLSYRVKALKPEPAIYADATGKLGVPPAECVYVDDIPEYAEGAARVGMHGVVFAGAARLEDELRMLGVDTR
ncbi:MAG TPA: HAD family phosphatase [Candidatus Deferrimicrobiaceae bacterium]